MDKKQTAVEWLVKELKLEGYDYTVEQAKQIEKEQIIEAACHDPFLGDMERSVGEFYYRDNFQS